MNKELMVGLLGVVARYAAVFFHSKFPDLFPDADKLAVKLTSDLIIAGVVAWRLYAEVKKHYPKHNATGSISKKVLFPFVGIFILSGSVFASDSGVNIKASNIGATISIEPAKFACFVKTFHWPTHKVYIEELQNPNDPNQEYCQEGQLDAPVVNKSEQNQKVGILQGAKQLASDHPIATLITGVGTGIGGYFGGKSLGLWGKSSDGSSNVEVPQEQNPSQQGDVNINVTGNTGPVTVTLPTPEQSNQQ